MARRKKFRRKTFRKKHKSRHGRKITSNKTRHFRGGISAMDLSKGLVNTAANGALTVAKKNPYVRVATALSETSTGKAVQAKLQERIQQTLQPNRTTI
jgi:hypothetical protein